MVLKTRISLLEVIEDELVRTLQGVKFVNLGGIRGLEIHGDYVNSFIMKGRGLVKKLPYEIESSIQFAPLD